MPKRGKRTTRKAAAPKGYARTIELLVENNVSLQKKMVDLTTSIDTMNKKVGRLLHLIEQASEEFTKGGRVEKESKNLSETALVDKLEGLINQNKTIARGLLLLEKYVREKSGRGNEGDKFKPLPEYKF